MRISPEFSISISTGASRMAKVWSNEQWPWATFVDKCESFVETPETLAEYLAMDRDRQGAIKDVGGFVGGHLQGGKRSKHSVMMRSLVCLDFDHVAVPWDTFLDRLVNALDGRAWLCYTTHKHTDASPRARVVVPMARPLVKEQYEPIGRAICAKIGIDWADSTTYAPERLMYWPSCSKDADRHATHRDGELATATWALDGSGVVLADPSTWPRGKDEEAAGTAAFTEGRGSGQLSDPCAKEGIVGQFCLAHWPLSEALDELLPGYYTKAPGRNRYTWAEGSTSGGALIYPDGERTREDCYLWSQHDTDPAKGMHNIFDLCRIHLYGDKDERMDPATPMCKRKSYLAMVDFAKRDPKTKAVIDKQNREAMAAMVEAVASETEPQGGQKAAEKSAKKSAKTGNKIPKFDNTINGAAEAIEMLLPNLYLDEFRGLPFVEGNLPWRKSKWRQVWEDMDEDVLASYLEPMGVTGEMKIRKGLAKVLNSRRRDVLREYLEGLEWDGNPRIAGGMGADGVERKPMLTRWLGVADTELYRAMAVAFFVGLAKRGLAYEPVKHDYVLALQGPEGIGKTTFCEIVGGEFYTQCALNLDDKDTFLTMSSSWLLEFAEIVSFRKATVELLKGFLTTSMDTYRKPYERRESPHFRRCAFIATTNDEEFIKSGTGMRQLWPIECTKSADREDLDTLRQEIRQIIAEAVHLAKNGAINKLTPELEEQAKELQRKHNSEEDDSLKPELEAFLEKGVPAAWEKMSRAERKAYPFKHMDDLKVVRNKFYAGEFVDEIYGLMPGTPTYKQMLRKINKTMEEIDGWERKNMLSVSDYGKQRGWVRSAHKEPDAEDFIGELL